MVAAGPADRSAAAVRPPAPTSSGPPPPGAAAGHTAPAPGPTAEATDPRAPSTYVRDANVLLPSRMGAGSDRAVEPGKLISHSDAGSQYTALRFTEHLALEGIAPSIGSVGDAYDNALMESVIGLFKTECIRTTVFHAGPYKTVSDVEYATAGWVDWWNNRRLHGTIGMITPNEAEQAHYAALIPQEQPV